MTSAAPATPTPVDRSSFLTSSVPSLTVHTDVQQDASVSIVVCTSVGTGCVTLPVICDSCINFTGGLSGLNKELTTAQIPVGFNCTFFQDFGCTATGVVNAGTDSEVVLQPGSWDLTAAPGLSGPTNFQDLTSSISCSLIYQLGTAKE
ncbi:hypothetical protein FB451DRAFT_1061756 [Mycena latifolia]|nr:hypothetical protein FB451DRAFT_1061756 [Mycena latifolia]